MSRRSLVLLGLLFAGVSALFFFAEGTASKVNPGDPHAGSPPGSGNSPHAGPFDDLGPRLRGLGAGPDAEITARGLVDQVLARVEASPRPVILQALRHTDWGIQWGGLLAVARYGPSDPPLAEAFALGLASDIAQVRRTAAEACAYLGPDHFPRVEAALEQAAGDPEAAVRAGALRTLARRTSRRLELVPLFERALGDDDGPTRNAGAYGLAQIEFQERLDDATIDRLRPQLARALQDPVTEVVMYAVMALGSAGARAAPEVPAILALLGDERALVRGQASTALGSIGAPALPLIEAALRHAEGRRVPALLWALRRMGKPAFSALERALVHEDPVVRTMAAQKLWEVEHALEPALDVLIASLGGEDQAALRIAARTLARMGTEGARALPALKRLRAHEDETIRAAVEAAIERLEAKGG